MNRTGEDEVVRHWGRRLALILGVGMLVVLLLACGYGLYLWTFLTLPRPEDRPPILIYGMPLLLHEGMNIHKRHLEAHLHLLDYHPVSSDVSSPGEYRLSDSQIDIYLRHDPQSHVQGFPLRLHLHEGHVTQLISLLDNEEVFPVSLAPPLISGVRGNVRQLRRMTPLSDFPEYLIQGVLAIEDHRFYRHVGVDPLAIGRAMVANIKHGGIVQGASTITQQLAKNVFFSHRRTWRRKVKEAIAAIVLESKYSKDEILEAYLNEVYFGQIGDISIYGVGEAGEQYFAKPVERLSLQEAALLAGMIQAPNTYSPFKHPDRSKIRRDLVLRRMVEEERITREQYQKARNSPVTTVPSQSGVNVAPYFVDYLLPQAELLNREPLLPGSTIMSTLDPVLQHIAEQALLDGLEKLEQTYPRLAKDGGELQGAIIALDPRTGGILAMVGGRDYKHSQFNRGVQAKRQPGSLFKVLVYLTAFEKRELGLKKPFTPATVIVDEEIRFSQGEREWVPQNYDKKYRGPVTVRTALELSLNVPAVKVAQWVGLSDLIRMSRNLGIQGPIPENLSIALGSAEVSLLEMVSLFGVIAQEGTYVAPNPLRGVVSPSGDTLWFGVPRPRQAVSAESAYLLSTLLEGAVERGTAKGVRTRGIVGKVGGKTGTTDGYRDAWFIGYTPEIVIGTWVGFDDGTSIGLSGSQAALPIWVELAKQILSVPTTQGPIPDGIVVRTVDPESGELASSKCPQRIEEFFIKGTEPSAYCSLHGLSWWEELIHNLGV